MFLRYFLVFIVVTFKAYSMTDCGQLFYKIAKGASLSSVKKIDSSISLSKVKKVIQMRVLAGDISKSNAESLINKIKASAKSGQIIIGSGILTCYKSFSEQAFENVNKLIMSIDIGDKFGPRSIFDNLTSASKRIFKDSDQIAKKRVCKLSGKGESCQIFSPKIAAINCN